MKLETAISLKIVVAFGIALVMLAVYLPIYVIFLGLIWLAIVI